MYGFIYNTLRNLVIEKFGVEVWIELCDNSGVSELKEGILDRHYYNEKYLEIIGTCASSKLGLPLQDILEMFGAFFFVTCKKSGHSSMLRTLGHNLYGFLMNLDTLHDHLSVTFTQMQAPSFRCEKTSMGGIVLHYYSRRLGLSSIVQGIVKAVAKDFYYLDVDVKQTNYEMTTEILKYHYVFSIEVQESSMDENYLERLIGELKLMPISPTDHGVDHDFDDTPALGTTYNQHNQICPMSLSYSTGIPQPHPLHFAKTAESRDKMNDEMSKAEISTEASDVIKNELCSSLSANFAQSGKDLPSSMLPQFSMSRMQSRRGSTFPGDSGKWPITSSIFQSCFPFHIIFDKDLVIHYMGISFSRIFPKAVVNKALLTEYFVLTRPAISLTYVNICSSLQNIFTISTSKSLNKKSVRKIPFRGQMIRTSAKNNCDILFLGSPRVDSIEELEHQGLYLSDIPVHDVTRDLILLNKHFHVERNTAAELQQTKIDLEVQKSRVEHEKHRADTLLHQMLPPSVASELIAGAKSTAMDYSQVTILFSDIKGFTTICNSCKPMQVVDMLNSLYTLFDHKSEFHNVYKVETIGDAYMVAAGLLDTAKDHAAAITNMAFSMREEAGNVLEPINQVPLQIRIGIHTGPVVAGVVGQKMPRFCLFGDTVNTASRMESHGSPGKVHISGETYNLIRKAYKCYSRGMIFVKGLGERETFFVEPLDSDENPLDELGIRDFPSNETSFIEMKPCRVNVSPINRPQKSLSFPEDEAKESSHSLHQPKVMDMIKPLPPSEEAWIQNRKKSEGAVQQASTPPPAEINDPEEKVDPPVKISEPSSRRRRHKCII